jgi:hypothetical protein
MREGPGGGEEIHNIIVPHGLLNLELEERLDVNTCLNTIDCGEAENVAMVAITSKSSME